MLSYLVDSSAGDGRRAHWNQAMREAYGPRWALNPARPADFRISMQAVQIGSVTLSRASLSAAEIRTRPHHFPNSAARSYNLYIVDRVQRLVLGGESIVLHPGDFTLADSAVTSAITTDEPYSTIGLTVPVSLLRGYLAHPDRAVGMRFSGSEGLPQAVSLMMRELWRLAESGSIAEVGNRMVVSLFEAFSACCTLAQSPTSDPTPNATTRREQIRQAIQERLRDPDLSVSSLARDLGLSTRYMQMVFNDADESICQHIRRLRLEGCRRDLADPMWSQHSVTAIAFRWGFNSAAHFCRAFQAHYGSSPSGFRERMLAKASSQRVVEAATRPTQLKTGTAG